MWTTTTTKESSSKHTFKDLVSKVQMEEANVGIEIIREFFENFVIEIGLELRKVEERTIPVSATDNFSLDADVISVLETYLDDVLLKPMSWEDYKTGEYGSNAYCYINNAERKIYFTGDLDGTEELKILATVSIDSVATIDATAELDIPNHYFLLAVFYILKEVFHTSKYFNEAEIIRFERKYDKLLDSVRSNPLDIKRDSTMEQLVGYNLEYT